MYKHAAYHTYTELRLAPRLAESNYSVGRGASERASESELVNEWEWVSEWASDLVNEWELVSELVG
jgi:hypothetical protein